MGSEMARLLRIAGKDVQYDAQCKKVLGQKVILSWILKYAAEEFRNMSLEEIGGCLTDRTDISVMPVSPGERDVHVAFLNTEDSIPDEGTICYDIRFNVKIPQKKSKLRMLVDLEAQKKYNPGYQIATRGIYYGARMVSAQFGTEFKVPKYNGIKKVYSIWICTNASRRAGNTIASYQITKKDIYGKAPNIRQAYDKITVVVVALNDQMETDHILLQMLNTLLSPVKDYETKKTELEQKFQICMQDQMEKEVKLMCNLSEYVLEVGMRKGREQGRKQGRKQGREQGRRQGREQGKRDLIIQYIDVCKKDGNEPEQIREQLMKYFSLSMKQAEQYVAQSPGIQN